MPDPWAQTTEQTPAPADPTTPWARIVDRLNAAVRVGDQYAAFRALTDGYSLGIHAGMDRMGEPEPEPPLGWMAMARFRPGGDYRPGAVADYHDNPDDARRERDQWIADGLDAVVVALVPVDTTQEPTP